LIQRLLEKPAMITPQLLDVMRMAVQYTHSRLIAKRVNDAS